MTGFKNIFIGCSTYPAKRIPGGEGDVAGKGGGGGGGSGGGGGVQFLIIGFLFQRNTE